MAKTGLSLAGQLTAAIRTAEKRGMTRYRLAQVSGVGEAQLSRLVRGQSVPHVAACERIAKALGCRIILARRKDT
jgi:transcriptional regulator with XRE-family HTH domain